MVQGDPLPAELPPDAAVYQVAVDPGLTAAASETVPVPQREPGVVPVTDGLFTETVALDSEQIVPETFTCNL